MVKSSRRVYMCRKCGQKGHNSRTCGKTVPPPTPSPSVSPGSRNSIVPQTGADASTVQASYERVVQQGEPGMVKVSSVADFKRKLANNDARYVVVSHPNPALLGAVAHVRALKTREWVARVTQIDGVEYEYVRFQYPKASETTIHADGSCSWKRTYDDEDTHVMMFEDEKSAQDFLTKNKDKLERNRTEKEKAKDKKKKAAAEARRAEQERREQWLREEKEKYAENPEKCRNWHMCKNFTDYQQVLCDSCGERENKKREVEQTHHETLVRQVEEAVSRLGKRKVTLHFKDGKSSSGVRIFTNQMGHCGYLPPGHKSRGYRFIPENVWITDDTTGEIVFNGAGIVVAQEDASGGSSVNDEGAEEAPMSEKELETWWVLVSSGKTGKQQKGTSWRERYNNLWRSADTDQLVQFFESVSYLEEHKPIAKKFLQTFGTDARKKLAKNSDTPGWVLKLLLEDTSPSVRYVASQENNYRSRIDRQSY